MVLRKVCVPISQRSIIILFYFRIAGILRDLLKEIPSQNKIVVIATVASAKALHPMLCNSDSTHLFTYEFVIPPLTKVTFSFLTELIKNRSYASGY